MSTKSTYEQALELESLGFYADALALLNECLVQGSVPRGDILFHCGWCVEQLDGSGSDRACELYERSIEFTTDPVGKTNAAFRAGWIRFHQHDHRGAATMFRRAMNEGNDVEEAAEIVHHAMYWLAVCLEAEGKFLEAITWYRRVRIIAPLLDPEARLREMYCNISVADFEAALQLSRTFEQDCPEGFSPTRYKELAHTAAREGEMLEHCLSPGVYLTN